MRAGTRVGDSDSSEGCRSGWKFGSAWLSINARNGVNVVPDGNPRGPLVEWCRQHRRGDSADSVGPIAVSLWTSARADFKVESLVFETMNFSLPFRVAVFPRGHTLQKGGCGMQGREFISAVSFTVRPRGICSADVPRAFRLFC